MDSNGDIPLEEGNTNYLGIFKYKFIGQFIRFDVMLYLSEPSLIPIYI